MHKQLRNLKRRTPIVVAIVGGTLVTSAAVAFATGQEIGANNTINGCYRVSEDDQKGQLRVVNDPTACRSNEAPISWNRVGQQGEQGPRGEQGIQGPPGTDGADGADGVSVTTASEPAGANCADDGVQLTAVNGISYVCNGERGPQGIQGEKGEKGEKGDTGATGPQGPPGGLSGYEIVSVVASIPANDLDSRQVDCPAGKRVLGGGALAGVTGPQSALVGSGPGTDGTYWYATFYNPASVAVNVRFYAICAI